ncbi:signal recognition particle-docking protein FtsY [Terricaulis sp.]|uniref:signal recognition particle-docking protein FtsY n=1 Tax=Terricaulis sp. TaxID=2768686 RepID=UPI002AC50D9E|nr:signal recognition particle-docking protein FtsY [Terricaulis sp.]MDZ4689984.1 signal recognition particle-docking protein FtsY [Terricaulis sp.]
MIWGLFDKKKKPEEAAPEQAKGLFDGLRKSSAKLADSFTAVFTKEKLDAADIAALEEVLIASDMGAAAASRIAAALADQRFSKENSDVEAREALALEVSRILKPREAQLDLTDGVKPRIVLVIGVNGSGKTTTIGKLADNLTNAGAKVIIGAADTFRAAAIEQLKVWADRADASFVSSTQGADAAGVAFETVKRAKEENADVALIDTAGRLQNKSELMAELAKIIRVMRKMDEDAPHETLLVLDATVGQNALSQVESFRSVTEITGLVMTKLDGTAKGGVLVAVAQRHAIPIHFIGVGEKAEDLQPFDATSFARALVGLST